MNETIDVSHTGGGTSCRVRLASAARGKTTAETRFPFNMECVGRGPLATAVLRTPSRLRLSTDFRYPSTRRCLSRHSLRSGTPHPTPGLFDPVHKIRHVAGFALRDQIQAVAPHHVHPCVDQEAILRFFRDLA